METKEQILQKCTVEGKIVKLPSIPLDRKLYMDVAKSLNLIGGKWTGGKIQGFTFNEDPTELLTQIAGGEKRNIKKEFQFYATPAGLADRLVELADVQKDDEICEPEAGQGSIIKSIQRVLGNDKKVFGYELMPENQKVLKDIKNFVLLGEDFLTCTKKFDKIVANPPFNKNQDIQHIMKMWDCLKDEGRIVTIASKHSQISTNKKEVNFQNWLKEVGAEIQELPEGEFKESGTNTASVIIVINKR